MAIKCFIVNAPSVMQLGIGEEITEKYEMEEDQP
jgi:hypothetical protein